MKLARINPWNCTATLLAVFGSVLLAGKADAISRYNPTTMTCSQVQATVKAEGAVILRWSSPRNPNLPIFGRYVAGRTYCAVGEIIESEYVPASNRKNCRVWLCKRDFSDDDDDLLKLWLRRR